MDISREEFLAENRAAANRVKRKLIREMLERIMEDVPSDTERDGENTAIIPQMEQAANDHESG